MTKSNYKDQAEALSKAIDIAIESIKKFPPKGFNSNHLDHFISTYLEFKNNVLNPELKYKNSKSLSYITNDVLTYFQESTGDAIHCFWEQINKQNLGFKRENKLNKILIRQKLKNQFEYDFIIDVLIPYQQEGLISEIEVHNLNQMILLYENKKNSHSSGSSLQTVISTNWHKC